jgi:putative membrane protein
MQNANGTLWKGAVAGLAAGLAATLVMTQFQNLSGKLEKALGPDNHGKKEKKGDDATMKAASAISHGVFHHTLTQREKKVAGPAVHYGFGTLTGGMYGALAELSPAVARGVGLPFGTALWLGADEVAVPVFGLSGPPASQPPAVHAKALASHWVYALALETTRRLVRRVL